MPIYVFDCKYCESSFEKLVRSSAAVDEVVCPECGSSTVQKRLVAFAAHVQGGVNRIGAAATTGCSTGGT